MIKNQPYLKILRNGHIHISAALGKLLEIEDEENDGVVFGYSAGASFIGYSSENDAYKGKFKKGESSFRFGSVDERDRIVETIFENVKDFKFPITLVVDPERFEIVNSYKMFQLIPFSA
jgi:hypothetical protein